MDEQIATSVQDNTVAETQTETNSVESSTSQETSDTNTSTSESSENLTTSPESAVETKSQETPPGAPEKYNDFTVPEGFTAPIEKFSEFAKSNNWTQEQAQLAIDFYTKEIAPQMQEQHKAQTEQWVTESKAKYGDAGIEAAKKALGRFSTPEFNQFLTDSKLGDHPEMIGIFKNISDKISDAGFIDGVSSYANSGPDPYPDLPQNRRK